MSSETEIYAVTQTANRQARRAVFVKALRLMAMGHSIPETMKITGLSHYQCARIRRDNLPGVAQVEVTDPRRWDARIEPIDVAMAIKGTRFEPLAPPAVAMFLQSEAVAS